MSFPREQSTSYCPESCEQVQSHVETLTQELNLYKHTVKDLLARQALVQRHLSLKINTRQVKRMFGYCTH